MYEDPSLPLRMTYKGALTDKGAQFALLLVFELQGSALDIAVVIDRDAGRRCVTNLIGNGDFAVEHP